MKMLKTEKQVERSLKIMEQENSSARQPSLESMAVAVLHKDFEYLFFEEAITNFGMKTSKTKIASIQSIAEFLQNL